MQHKRSLDGLREEVCEMLLGCRVRDVGNLRVRALRGQR